VLYFAEIHSVDSSESVKDRHHRSFYLCIGIKALGQLRLEMSSVGQLPMLDEYDVIFEELGDSGAAFWKFFDIFRIQLETEGPLVKGIYFGKAAHWSQATDDQLKELRAYWKEQRKWIKKEGKKGSSLECRRRMWFWMGRIIEWNMFTYMTRREISYWFDTCEERTLKSQDRVV
jgi:hypothetical protein